MSFLVSWLSNKPASDVSNNASTKVLSDSSKVPAKVIMERFVLIEDYDPKFLTAQRIVTQLTPLIEKNITTEGLYRVSASAAPLKVFFETLRSDPKVVVPDATDAHTLTGVLKLALRELDPRLLQCQFALWQKAAKAISLQPTIADTSIQQAFKALPKEKAACAKTLFTHLHQISLRAETNKMDAKNLSSIFTPSLIECSYDDLVHFIALFTYLIEHPEVL